MTRIGHRKFTAHNGTPVEYMPPTRAPKTLTTTVPCPTCGAPVDVGCTSPTGNRCAPHIGRRRLAMRLAREEA